MIKHARNEFPSDVFTMLEGVGAKIIIREYQINMFKPISTHK